MLAPNLRLVKEEADKLELKPETIISGIRLFKGKIFLIIDELVETQMEILSLKQKDVDDLSQLFSFARLKQVEFYYVEEEGIKKLRMKSIVKPVEKQQEKKPLDKDIWDELTGKKKSYENVDDFLSYLFGGKQK